MRLDDGKSDDDEPENTNLMEKINQEESRKITGKVRGVLKKLNKTYGGSIIKKEDMLASTLTKFKLFCQNHDIKDDSQYRVFIPYDILMPQCIVKSQKPEALQNKRIIIRIADWK